jgi:hypothetical protein
MEGAPPTHQRVETARERLKREIIRTFRSADNAMTIDEFMPFVRPIARRSGVAPEDVVSVLVRYATFDEHPPGALPNGARVLRLKPLYRAQN